MMTNTPRVFVGTTTFLLAGMASSADLEAVTAAITTSPGVRVLAGDHLAGVVTVATERPVDRADLTSAIVRAGYTVLA